MYSNNQVRIFDTTLRDGQQCPGAGMSFKHNMEYARLAAKLGVDVLEAGFPSASKVDFNIVKAIAEELAAQDRSPIIAGLCQLRIEQIDRTIEALEPAIKVKRALLHTYLPVDPNLMEASLGAEAVADKDRFIKNVFDYCKRAVDAGLQVEFSPEGYSRMGSNFEFVTDLIRAAVEAGASTINCPDTIGGAGPWQGEEYFVRRMAEHARIIDEEYPENEVVWSTHCHNDLGLAVYNSVAAVLDGPARQIEGCFNGIGERAGNAALEQCLIVLRQFGANNQTKPFSTGIDFLNLQSVSDFVADHMLPRQPHWPVTGDNAAKHSSGGHTNAVLNNPLAYQPFDPRETGKEISLLFTPLSGGNHARSIVQSYGYVCKEYEKGEIAQFIKDLYSDRRKGITDEELLEGYFEYRRPIKVREIDYARTKDYSELYFEGDFFGRSGKLHESYQGKDSALTTLKQAIDKEFDGVELTNYTSEAVGTGIHATSRSSIIVRNERGQVFTGVAEDNDISKSAMLALISAVNQAYIDQHFRIED